MRYKLLLLSLLWSLKISAQTSYDADLIPMALKSRANAIIRHSETVVDMRAENNVGYIVKNAITVFNKSGEDRARLVIFYDKNISIKSIKGTVYNASGSPIAKFSQSDFSDESAVNDFSLFEDTRVKHYLPNINNYPYTIVYEYELRFKQNLIIPDWEAKPYRDFAVEKSNYTFICKPGDKIRIKEVNFSGKADTLLSEKEKRITWTVNNLPAQRVEAYSPPEESYAISVKISPQTFSYFNKKGTFSNWNELGKWIYADLLKDRRGLPVSTISQVRELVKDCKTDKEKAQKIYEFMQQKTRYISVQVGIGGFQPMLASEVDRLGYGDCKALVNYTQSLLQAADIESYYCVVNAGSTKKSLISDFASMQGNHVILCLPFKGDTTWLECTSQKMPFGFLGDFTDDRTVLACTPEGGKLMHTPKLSEQANLQKREASFMLTKEGHLSGSMSTTFLGARYNNHEHIIDQAIAEQEKFLKEVYDINNIDFTKVSYTQNKNAGPSITENLTLQINRYAALNNDLMYLPLNPFNRQNTVPDVKNRAFPLYINRGYTDEDMISYTLPDNFIFQAPKDVELDSAFGKYSAKFSKSGNKLVYTRKITINEGTYPAESYAVYADFIKNVSQMDHIKLVLSAAR